MSFLLGISAIISIIIGILLVTKQATVGILFILWGANGFVQSPGGPASYSTITRWTPKLKRGRWLGFWNASHNIGGALAGIVAFGVRLLSLMAGQGNVYRSGYHCDHHCNYLLLRGA